MLSPGDVVLHSFDLQHGVDVFEAGSVVVISKLGPKLTELKLMQCM